MMNNTKITKKERAGDNQDTYLCGSAMSLYTQESTRECSYIPLLMI
jgi:hypothetical protein